MMVNNSDRNFQRGLDAIEEIDVLKAAIAQELVKLGETFRTIRRREEGQPDA